MQRNLWNSLRATALLWRWALPGMVVIGLVIAARLTGSLQSLELLTLDAFLRHRPTESKDDRIVLVGIDATAIQQTGYPIPERDLVDLLNRLQTYKPAVIGLHILQNQIAKSDKVRLAGFKQRQKLIVSETVLTAADQIPPPPGFFGKQVGLIDLIPEGDNRANNHVRRALLGIYDPLNAEAYKFSLTIRLVETYLTAQDKNLTLQNGLRDKEAMRFGLTELPRLKPSGAYAGVGTGSPQILLNFRQHHQPFRVLSLNDVRAGKVDPNWLRDRIIIVGITDPKIRPIIPTAAIAPTNSLDIQAHTVSQIISAVLDQRLLLTTWTEGWEYGWILGWGILGVYIDRRTRGLIRTLFAAGIANLLLVGGSYTLLLLQGLWLPVLPALIVLNLSVVLPAVYSYVYEHEKTLKTRLDERQRTIEQTFNTLHNGPLQTLASLLRQGRDNKLPQEQLFLTLENLNAEIRGVGEHLKQEALTQEESLHLRSGLKLDLKLPLHELLYEVYTNTLERSDFSQFATLKTSCYFEPLEKRPLTIDQKRDLCRFIEEALCNVGKHAEDATHLDVTGTQSQKWYCLRVFDNGKGIATATPGEGTKHARKLAFRLGGKFKRETSSPQGTLCELAFPLTKPWFQ
ncbi:CHASE2 domain-containing protein [Leptolyngbya sp. FACHB-321]|uniref:sensor histidine kinase n=1 Tax=Leptolyngbya sp. FACHB-321 TaxID=2692807 RepID=UPI001689F197|nr:CHASE2 domain-containing protein [Leptolyngbya sp. FACHB-321]MBD2034338.1 CHASE2 domain-containing protein [Leptolyngbya sp. FACHB-321]